MAISKTGVPALHSLTSAGADSCVNIVGMISPPSQLYSESKILPIFSDIFLKRLVIFSPNFTCLLYVPIYAGILFFIQLPANLTKLRHIKHDHHYMLKMSTIG